MSIIHPVFIRKARSTAAKKGKKLKAPDKAMLLTVMPDDFIEDLDDDSFVIAHSYVQGDSIVITLDKKKKFSPEAYHDALPDKGFSWHPNARLDQVAMTTAWFIQRVRSIMDELFETDKK